MIPGAQSTFSTPVTDKAFSIEFGNTNVKTMELPGSHFRIGLLTDVRRKNNRRGIHNCGVPSTTPSHEAQHSCLAETCFVRSTLTISTVQTLIHSELIHSSPALMMTTAIQYDLDVVWLAKSSLAWLPHDVSSVCIHEKTHHIHCRRK